MTLKYGTDKFSELRRCCSVILGYFKETSDHPERGHTKRGKQTDQIQGSTQGQLGKQMSLSGSTELHHMEFLSSSVTAYLITVPLGVPIHCQLSTS